MKLASVAKVVWAVAMLLIGLQACRLLDDVIKELAYLQEIEKGVRTNTSEIGSRR